VSRLFSKWQADGVLHSTGRRLMVRSPSRLDALTLAEGD